MVKQDASLGRQWYVVHTYSGYEDAVKKALEQRIESMNMQDYIFEIVVPKKKVVTTTRGGKQAITEKNIFPGYVLVNMIVTEASWFIVRNTPNVSGFVGSGNTPVPVLPEEFGLIQKQINEDTPETEIKLQIGDIVKIKEGPFANYEGTISEINAPKAKVTVLVSIFDRETPVELDFTEVILKK